MLDLSKLNPNDKNALFVRHTERFKIPQGESGDDVDITPNGEEMAKDFGNKIKNFKLNKIISSPIKRCIQTSEKIIEGYEKKLDIITSDMIGGTSAYIKDFKEAFNYIYQNEFYSTYYKYLETGNLPGFYSLTEGSERLEEFIKSNTSEKGITLFISHDIIILHFIYYKTKQIFNKENWLKYLDGIHLIY